jgi:hypothetical protein
MKRELRGCTVRRMPHRFCNLQLALGRVERCPETVRCTFWDDDRCVLDPLGPHLERSREFAEEFLRVRGALEGARPGALGRPTAGR